jgi:hypothetical protein
MSASRVAAAHMDLVLAHAAHAGSGSVVPGVLVLLLLAGMVTLAAEATAARRGDLPRDAVPGRDAVTGARDGAA